MSDHKKRCRKKHQRSKYSNKKSIIYGEFIRTFTFGTSVQEPIVQPGGSIVFPTPTVPPKGVVYVDNNNQTGLLIPQGTYLVSWTINTSQGATIDLLINGQKPVTPTGYPYAEAVTTDILNFSYLIQAPLKRNNLLSLVNGGNTLFTLSTLPNTQIGNTGVITHIRVQKID